MIEIDGGFASGGGQILRTAVGLSALTGKACRITNVRAKRSNPGLREQHLQAIKAVAELCSGELVGAQIGSTRIEFYPHRTREGGLNVNIATAGSVGLVSQALLIPALQRSLRIRIKGGATYGKWAVPIAYLQNVLSPLLKRMGYEIEMGVMREGFYPQGGAEVEVRTRRARFRPLDITERGGIVSIKGISVASDSLEKRKVAERQREACEKLLFDHFKVEPLIEVRYSPSLCPGSGIQVWVETANSVIGGNGLGEPGKKAEEVGREAARSLISEFEGGPVDSYAGDQLLPYLALAGGRIQVSRITDHCQANAFVIEKFLPVRFQIAGRTISVQK
ncbi:MAG TPA: RNA 3'-terminal phosphate cyclase [Candidatus Latescibacteria bacterium]|nr:RNA 3'-terminal phosphate cyclase [Candidatus Latescibacterota bacterium]